MGLHKSMRTEPVSKLALREPVLAEPDETVRDVVCRMREKQLGCVFVVDEDRKPIGMYTENLLNKLLVTNPQAMDDAIRRHMADYWCCVTLTDPIVNVLTAMKTQNVRFVCVVDDQGRVAALTGQRGLMEYIAEFFPRQVMNQRIGCSPVIRQREGA